MNKILQSLLLLCLLSTGQSVFSQCPGTPPGDQSTYGDNQWIGYVYSDIANNALPPDGFSANYKGYVIEANDFEMNIGGNSISGPNLCGTYDENFAVRYKMRKDWIPGYYTFFVGADDGYRVSFDGGATFLGNLSEWSDHGYNTKAATYYMSGVTDMVLEYFEHGGASRVTFDFYEPQCTSTAPTGINGNTVVSCNAGTTLYATGGVNAVGTTYQWGTGSIIGQNVIAGQTQEQITVHPLTDTTYWVRRYVGPPCIDYTGGVTIDVTVADPPAGNPAEYGDNVWNVYGFNNTATLNPQPEYYSGYYTQNTLGFDTTPVWPRNAAPSNASNWQGCPMQIDNYSFVHKRKGFPCGRYTLIMKNWDDDSRLYVNGVQVWQANGWSGGEQTEIIGTYDLNGESTIELRTLEGGGDANAKLTIDEVVTAAPTGITGTTTVCSGAATTLTAAGGATGTSYAYEWGTGTVGSNVLPGQTVSSITVTPTQNITYWVRVKYLSCGTYSSAATANITTTASGAGTVSSTTTMACYNTAPGSIALSGNTGNVIKWQSANDIAFVSGVTDIANTTTTLTGAAIGPLSATRYFRAVIDGGSCGPVATAPHQVTVAAPLVWNGSWNGTPDITTAVVIESSLPMTEDLTVCSCEVKNTAMLTVPAGVNFTVKGKITVAGTAKLIVENTGSLLQIDNVANDGKIELNRNSSLIKRLDYSIWSSPVTGQQLQSFSPQTLSDRFFIYNTATNQYNSTPASGNFSTGTGYLIRTPNNHPLTAAVHAGTFTGQPNNGDISKATTYISDMQSYNAVGNPYPSPISLTDFIDANIDNIEGTLYFWRKTNDQTQSSYTTLTKFAYSANSAPGGSNSYAVNPNGLINTGQGFILKAKNAQGIVFNNSMRRGSSTTQFFRSAPAGDAAASKIWLSAGATGKFSQTVVGYTPEATLDYDNGLDGRTLMEGPVNLYSLAGTNKLAIQARPAFAMTDVVPMGFRTTAAGSFEIKIDAADGLFIDGSQKIFLKDNTTTQVHDLTQGSYTFTSPVGSFDTRFEVLYTNQTLGTDNPEIAARDILVYRNGKKISIQSPQIIKSVTVFDILGKTINVSNKIDAMEFSTSDLTVSNQILIVKVVLDNGQILSKKIIID